MKKTLLIAGILLLSVSPAMAHCGTCGVGEAKGSGKGSGSGDMVEHKTAMMTESLGLSAEQSMQYKAILMEKKAKKQAAMDEYTAKVEALLTPEQQTKLDAMMAEKGSMKGSEKGSKKGSMKGSGHGHEHKGSH